MFRKQYRRNIHFSDLYAWFIAECGGMISIFYGAIVVG